MASALFKGPEHAILYSKFRPVPPAALVQRIIDYVKDQVKESLKLGIDIGCGSGQSTLVLAPHFEKVVGLDISEAQIESARNTRSLFNIDYRVSDCRKLPFPSSSVQLVTFCQSAHWFDTKELFSEVHRVLIPNGVVAIYGYWIPLPRLKNQEKNEKIHQLILEYLYEEQLGKYWNKERYIVQSRYADIPFPFKDVQRIKVIETHNSSLADYIGYLSTWSSYQKLFKVDKHKAEEILKYVQKKSAEILQTEHSSKETILTLNTEFFMVMGHS